MSTKNLIFRHVIVWLIYIAYELACIQFTVGIKGSITVRATYYLLYIGLFYTNAHLILDFSFFKTSRPYLISVLLVSAELGVFIIIKVAFDCLLNYSSPFNYHLFVSKSYLLSNVFRAIFYVGFSIAYWSMLYFIRFKKKNYQIETAQLKTLAVNLELENKFIAVENAYLHNQISPHLLFNTLNIIYQAVKPNSPEAGESVARLAELMRYSLVSSDDVRTVLLNDEVKQIDNLVELCRMRFGKEFFFRFHKRGKMQNIKIIPLILITLVENMMKHGDLGEKKHPGRVSLEYSGDRLLFETSNKKRKSNLYPNGGLGLKNIEKRLYNYYQEKYTLLILDNNECFTVNLIIEL